LKPVKPEKKDNHAKKFSIGKGKNISSAVASNKSTEFTNSDRTSEKTGSKQSSKLVDSLDVKK